MKRISLRTGILIVLFIAGVCLALLQAADQPHQQGNNEKDKQPKPEVQKPDKDGMDDEYEIFFGLDITTDDAAEDYDEDTLPNIKESELWTDPFSADTDRDGFDDSMDSNAVSRAFINWGNPFFTISNEYEYVAPEWWIASFKIDGQWQTNEPTAWHVVASETDDVGRLIVAVDRHVLTNNAVLKLDFFDHANASLYVDLLDTNGNVITAAYDLFGNLCGGSNMPASKNLNIPFESYEGAVAVQIRRGHGEATVYTSLLYVDIDGDGLDDDQEKQLGTNPFAQDSDGDDLSDYDEIFTHGTDPLSKDTDSDGMQDGLEVKYGLNPLKDDAAQDKDGDDVDNLTELLQCRNPAVCDVEDTADLVNLKVYTVLEPYPHGWIKPSEHKK